MDVKAVRSMAQEIRNITGMSDVEFANWMERERGQCKEIFGHDIWPVGTLEEVRPYVVATYYEALVDQCLTDSKYDLSEI